jgi:hypothetical protein
MLLAKSDSRALKPGFFSLSIRGRSDEKLSEFLIQSAWHRMENFSRGKLHKRSALKSKIPARGSYYQFDVLFATLTAV